VGVQKSPLITRQMVKDHVRYVWSRRKAKVNKKIRRKVRKAWDRVAYLIKVFYDRLPYRIVRKGKVVDPMGWLSVQDLFLSQGPLGSPGYPGSPNNPITAADRGDVPIPLYSTDPREYLGFIRKVPARTVEDWPNRPR